MKPYIPLLDLFFAVTPETVPSGGGFIVEMGQAE